MLFMELLPKQSSVLRNLKTKPQGESLIPSHSMMSQRIPNIDVLSENIDKDAGLCIWPQTPSKHKKTPPIAKVMPVSRCLHFEDASKSFAAQWNAVHESKHLQESDELGLTTNFFTPQLNSFKRNLGAAEINFLASLYMTGFPYIGARCPPEPCCSRYERNSSLFLNKTSTFLSKPANTPTAADFNGLHLPMDNCAVWKPELQSSSQSPLPVRGHSPASNDQKNTSELLQEKSHFTDNMNTKKRRKRTIFSRKQVESLEELFETDHYPSMEARQKLAKYCGLEEEKIQVWFQNRRAKWRKSENTWGHSSEMAEYGLYGAMIRHGIPLPKTLIDSKCIKKLKNTMFVPWLLEMHMKGVRIREQAKSGSR